MKNMNTTTIVGTAVSASEQQSTPVCRAAYASVQPTRRRRHAVHAAAAFAAAGQAAAAQHAAPMCAAGLRAALQGPRPRRAIAV